MFQLKHIDHVALTVKDVNRSAAWYGEVLGLKRRHQESWGDYPAVMCAGQTGLALFPASGKLRPSPPPERSAVLRHVAFRADAANFRQARSRLRARGIAFHPEDHGISRSIYFRDPDGYQIEITTYEVGRPARRQAGGSKPRH